VRCNRLILWHGGVVRDNGRSSAVYSTATTDSAALAVAVERYNAADAESNRKLGLVSDCSFVPPPKVDCVEGFCTR